MAPSFGDVANVGIENGHLIISAAVVITSITASRFPPSAGAAATMATAWGGPKTLHDIGKQAWIPAADDVRAAQQQLQQIVNAIPESQWKDKTKNAYVERIQNYNKQLNAFEIYIRIAGWSLVIAAYALVVVAAIAAVFAAILFLMWALSWIPPIAPFMQAKGTIFAGFVAGAMSVVVKVLVGVMAAIGLVLQGGAALESGIEQLNGSKTAWKDFTSADAEKWKDSLAGALMGLVGYTGLKFDGKNVPILPGKTPGKHRAP